MVENGKYDGCGLPAKTRGGGLPVNAWKIGAKLDTVTNLQPMKSSLGWIRTFPGPRLARVVELWPHLTGGERGQWTLDGLRPT